MNEFEIRTAGLEDREQVIRLMREIYPGDMSARYDWLYVNNPHGRALTWVAVELSTGNAVGCTSIFPRRVAVQGCRRVGGIGGDCFIEPRVRRQGLATRLHAASFEQIRQRGVDFMYGPPTPRNLGALLKAGSRVVTGYGRWVRPLTSRGAYRAAFSRTPSKTQAHLGYLPIVMLDHFTKSNVRGFTLERVCDFGQEFDQMFDRAAAEHRITCSRDSEYLAWRYLAAPARRQTPMAVKRGDELVGFVALERAGEFAAIADIFCSPDPMLMDVILQLAIEHATASGCSSLEISATQGGALSRRLRRHGFVGRGERGFQVAVAASDPQDEVLMNSRAWHFTEADQDLDSVFAAPIAIALDA